MSVLHNLIKPVSGCSESDQPERRGGFLPHDCAEKSSFARSYGIPAGSIGSVVTQLNFPAVKETSRRKASLFTLHKSDPMNFLRHSHSDRMRLACGSTSDYHDKLYPTLAT